MAIGAYVLYIASEYVVLRFSRCREYYADRFAGRATGNPNALASALVKIGYGLAARVGSEEGGSKESGEEKPAAPSLDAIGALGIFDRKSAVAMVAGSAAVGFERGGGTATAAPAVRKENLKSAMQWDLWNPWAAFHELSSTHPLVAHRLQYLSDQAAAMGDEPYIVFDRRKPESYWDEFAVDLAVMFRPLILMTAGLAVSIVVGFAAPGPAELRFIPIGRWGAMTLVGLPILGLGVGSFLKTRLVYWGDDFAPLSVAGLLHKVKVSSVRPVPARLRGTIIGKGVPGLIWSEDFVMRDGTGILFLDYRQPLRIWVWLFGLFRAGEFAGKSVEVVGGFRRAPLPYLELRSITVDGRTRESDARRARYIRAAFLAVVGVGMILAGLVMR